MRDGGLCRGGAGERFPGLVSRTADKVVSRNMSKSKSANTKFTVQIFFGTIVHRYPVSELLEAVSYSFFLSPLFRKCQRDTQI